MGATLKVAKLRELEELARQQLDPREQLAAKEADVTAKQEFQLRAAMLDTRELEELARHQLVPRERQGARKHALKQCYALATG